MSDVTLTQDATVAGGTGERMIVCEGVDKFFGDFQALKNINLVVGKQEVVVVIGPSGSGKSTLCRAINRLETIDDGTITVDGKTQPEEGKALAQLRADVETLDALIADTILFTGPDGQLGTKAQDLAAHS
jgi:glutamate transport system ATP-binding protein